MRTWTLVLVLAVLGIVVGTLLTGTVMTLGLPLTAAAVFVAIVASRPRGWAWRLAAAGSLAWVVEEVAWALKRSAGIGQATNLTDVTYYLGVVLWAAALLMLRGRRARTRLWLLLAPAAAIVVWMLVAILTNSILRRRSSRAPSLRVGGAGAR